MSRCAAFSRYSSYGALGLHHQTEQIVGHCLVKLIELFRECMLRAASQGEALATPAGSLVSLPRSVRVSRLDAQVRSA